MGAGKSSIMYYVVHKAHEKNWLVVYIPLCDEWVKKGRSNPADWFAYFFDAVLAGLKHVPPNIAKKYEYCKHPKDYTSWMKAALDPDLSLNFFQDLFRRFREDIATEAGTKVLLAFNESQAILRKGDLIDPEPFSIIDWSTRYEQGCVFVTAIADSPYRRTIQSGYGSSIFNVGCLSDKDFSVAQYSAIRQHREFNDDYIPELRSITGLSPRELVTWNKTFANMEAG